MKTMEIMALCMVAAIVSFLGFVVENVWIAILLIYLILGTPNKLRIFRKVLSVQNKILMLVIYFVGVMICVSLGEVLLGTVVEKVCHFQWWDYSKIPFHFTQYTSLPTSFMFSSMITAFMNHFFEPLCQLFLSWDKHVLMVVSVTVSGLLLGDFFYNGYKMYKTKGMIVRWKIVFAKNKFVLIRGQ